MALIAGLGLGVGGAFAMEMLKAGFTTPREVEEALGVPVLASVHRLNKSQLVKDGKTRPSAILPNAFSALAFQRSHAHLAQWHPYVGRRPAA